MSKIYLTASIAIMGSAIIHAEVQKPNIMLILVDDLGKEWVKSCGSDYDLTPNIDKLSSQGMHFKNAYSMPQCTPTRATILTGQYPFSHGWINHWDVPRWGNQCQFDKSKYPSLGNIMKEAGYSTFAAGKWQINDFRVQPDAMQQHGFDDFCMWTGYEAQNPPSGKRYWEPYLHTKSGSKTYPDKFGEDVFTDRIIDFMGKNREKPMFIYYPMCLTHTPFTTTPSIRSAKTKMEKHQAMVRYTDEILGRLTDSMEKLKIRDNTIIIWTTDNGTVSAVTGLLNGRKVRGGKTRTIESGINAPFIVNAPGLVKPAVTDALVDFTDILPTCAELGGYDLSHVKFPIDGKSFAPLLLGKSDDSKRDWILAMGSKPAKMVDGRVVPVHKFRDRVIRDKNFKVFVNTNRKIIKMVDLRNDFKESNCLLKSEKTEHKSALEKFRKILSKLPKTDASPKYDKTPKQPWDLSKKQNKNGKH